jgi:hypothetical protein
MANALDDFYDQVEAAVTAQESRHSTYTNMYTEEHAIRLGEAYKMYPWVNPQILTSTILSNNDEALPMIAEYAARKMMEAGKTTADISKEDDERETIAGRYISKVSEEKNSGDILLNDMREGLRWGRNYG